MDRPPFPTAASFNCLGGAHDDSDQASSLCDLSHCSFITPPRESRAIRLQPPLVTSFVHYIGGVQSLFQPFIAAKPIYHSLPLPPPPFLHHDKHARPTPPQLHTFTNMERRVRPAFSRLVALLATFLFAMSATADFTVSYCSNQNTGSTDDCECLCHLLSRLANRVSFLDMAVERKMFRSLQRTRYLCLRCHQVHRLLVYKLHSRATGRHQ